MAEKIVEFFLTQDYLDDFVTVNRDSPNDRLENQMIMVDEEARGNRHRAISLAVVNNFKEAALWLLTSPLLEPVDPQYDQCNVFFLACANGRFEMAQMLESMGGSDQQSKNRALVAACDFNSGSCIEIVRWLIDQGADYHHEQDYCLTRPEEIKIKNACFRYCEEHYLLASAMENSPDEARARIRF